MFHAFDNIESAQPEARADWMALLSRAPLELLESAVGPHWPAKPNWLRAPETGLMMIQGAPVLQVSDLIWAKSP
jgi:alpha-D-ribose 1-methylphosphonate 5-triphosphate synthase subunit PhnG